MITKPKHKNSFFYPTGLISLILLPVICIWYLNHHKAFDQQRALEVIWWYKDWNKYFDDVPYKVHPERKFIDITFTGDNKDDKNKLDNARIIIKQLVSNKDTINGIQFHFDSSVKYWTLIQAINICRIENAKYFVPKDDDLWVFNYFPIQKELNNKYKPFCATGILGNDLVFVKSEEEITKERRAIIDKIIEETKRFSFSVLLFIIMIILTFKRINRKSFSNNSI